MQIKKAGILEKLNRMSRLFADFFKKEQNLKEKNKKIVHEVEAALKNKAAESLRKKISQI